MPQAFVPIVHGAALDRPDDADTLRAAEAVSASLRSLGHASETIALSLDLSPLAELPARRPLAVFNLVEALDGNCALSQAVPLALDHLGMAYTGVPAAAYASALSKLTTKLVLERAGLPTPPWWLCDVPPEETVIVKAITEHGSVGMDMNSVVSGRQADAEILSRSQRFGSPFFAERYLHGREFNISMIETVSGPIVLPIQEIVFESLPDDVPHIVDFDAKWIETSATFHDLGRRFGVEKSEHGLGATLAGLALRCWQSFGFRGFARIDFRSDGRGGLYIVDVNANPGIGPDAGFLVAAERAGMSFTAVVEHLLAAALRHAPRKAA